MFGSLGQKFPKEFSVRRSLDVTPSRSATYMVDGGMFDAYGNGNVFNRHALINEKTEYFLNLFICQNRMRNISPLWHFAGMSPRVVNGRLGSASSFNGILSILLLSSPSQVIGVAARRVVARVKSVMKTFGWESVSKYARNPRRDDISAHRTYSHYAVAFPMSCLSNPRPALGFASDINLTPKPFNFFFRDMHHVSPLASDKAFITHIGGWYNR